MLKKICQLIIFGSYSYVCFDEISLPDFNVEMLKGSAKLFSTIQIDICLNPVKFWFL